MSFQDAAGTADQARSGSQSDARRARMVSQAAAGVTFAADQAADNNTAAAAGAGSAAQPNRETPPAEPQDVAVATLGEEENGTLGSTPLLDPGDSVELIIPAGDTTRAVFPPFFPAPWNLWDQDVWNDFMIQRDAWKKFVASVKDKNTALVPRPFDKEVAQIKVAITGGDDMHTGIEIGFFDAEGRLIAILQADKAAKDWENGGGSLGGFEVLLYTRSTLQYGFTDGEGREFSHERVMVGDLEQGWRLVDFVLGKIKKDRRWLETASTINGSSRCVLDEGYNVCCCNCNDFTANAVDVYLGYDWRNGKCTVHGKLLVEQWDHVFRPQGETGEVHVPSSSPRPPFNWNGYEWWPHGG